MRKIDLVSNHESDNLFINTRDSGISPIVISIDCMRLTTFKGSKSFYLKVQDVIDWHIREVRESGGKSGSLQIAELLTGVLKRWRPELNQIVGVERTKTRFSKDA